MLVLKKDKQQNIAVCSNQSKKGLELIEQYKITESIDSTIIYIFENNVYYRSTAALQIAKKLKGAYPLLALFLIIPAFIRDSVYNFIAKYRKKIVKNNYSCEFVTDKKIKDRIHF